MQEYLSIVELLSALGGSAEEARADGAPKDSRIQRARDMKRLMDQMPGGFFIYRADEREEILYANTAMLRIFNCETMEEFRTLTGNSFKGIVHSEDLQAVEESIARQISESCFDLDYVEYRIVQKGGGIRWIEDYGHFVRSESMGDFFYVFAGDSTEKRLRREAERAALLQETRRKERRLQSRIDAYHKELEGISQEYLRHLEVIEGLSIDYESIFYVDLDTGAIQTYRASCRMDLSFGGGLKPRSLNGFASDYIRLWVHPGDRLLVSKAFNPGYLREQLENRRTLCMNYRVVQNGEPEYLQLRAVNVGGGERVSQVVIGIRSVEEDIRNELKQRQFLERALQQASSAVAAKTAFLSNMSHDMRTPMNAVIGFAALAKKHLTDQDRLLEYLGKIEDSSGQLLQLINDVLEISRMEAGKIHIEEGPCSLPELLQEVYQEMRPRAEAKQLAVTVSSTRLRRTVVYSDRQLLNQLLTRFTSNAVKYTEPGGRVSVTAEELEGAPKGYGLYRFVVEDTGVGISQDFLGHLFTPFERQRNTTLSGVYGTGLGLTIAKNITDMLGGTIEVQSEAGKGSRFAVTLTLPVRDEGTSAPSAETLPEVHTQGGGRILVVEDNAINLELELELLQDAGYHTDTAENGKAALEKVQASRPGDFSLILMDIQMPVMNGYQAARAIRSLPDPAQAAIPIVALSANAFEEDRRMARESGMDAHMAKPIQVAQLMELIEKLVGPPRES